MGRVFDRLGGLSCSSRGGNFMGVGVVCMACIREHSLGMSMCHLHCMLPGCAFVRDQSVAMEGCRHESLCLFARLHQHAFIS